MVSKLKLKSLYAAFGLVLVDEGGNIVSYQL